MWAITDRGWRAVGDDFTEADLAEGETLVEELPQWLIDKNNNKEVRDGLVAGEDSWRRSELYFIADQLLAIEDEDPNALPGTDREWRDYRITVRAWKDGAEDFPDSAKRPIRP